MTSFSGGTRPPSSLIVQAGMGTRDGVADVSVC
jgi:hypothetical protein